MKIALCNEVLRELSFPEQCRLAGALGYVGLEVAPFTLSDEPHRIPTADRAEYRRIAEGEGIRITGLHWLLVTPPGLSVTTADRRVWGRTTEVMRSLVDLCAELGGEVLIHGSPKQRLVESEEDRHSAEKRAEDAFRLAAEHAEKAGVTYCIEALTAKETNYINSLSEAAALVERIESPAFGTMLDTKAAFGSESESVSELCDRWLPTGLIRHVHVNDRSLKAPGQGNDRFAPILSALLRNGYEGMVGVEPFDYFPDGPTQAARAIGYIRGILEALEEHQ